MKVLLIEWITLFRICLTTSYTWTYNDWLNQVSKQWGSSNFKIQEKNKETFNCKPINIIGTNGTISTPNYPEQYPNNAECVWVIETEKEFNEIHLELVKFNVENPKWSKICFKDSVEIYQYIHGRKEKKGIYCGKLSGQNITVYSNKVEIVFKSNSYRRKKGFKINWTGRRGCGGVISGKEGKLLLPKSSLLDLQFFCEWRIKAPSTHTQIEINIKTLIYPRNYTNCKQGSLVLSDNKGQTLGEYCDSTKNAFVRVLGQEVIVRMRISKKTEQHKLLGSWKTSVRTYQAQDCGVPTIDHRRIRRLVGGQISMQGESPWVVQIRTLTIAKNFRSRTVICGGVIISPTLILSAAHCVARKTKVMKYEILIGTTSEYITDQKILELNEKDVFPHPKFQWKQNGKPENDIALLRLPKPLTFSHNIQPICLSNIQTQISDDCEFSGWGKTSENSLHSFQLNTIKAYKWGHCDNTPSILCVSYHGKTNGACKGDSGSPIVCKGSDERYYASGLLSYGSKVCPSAVDGYVDISYYLDWIHNMMEKLKPVIDNN